MGRLKRDHSGYHTIGPWVKNQHPSSSELPVKHKSKKDTRRWCKGKPGVEHAFVRRFKHYSWAPRRSKLIYTVCTVCGKQTWSKHGQGVRLVIEIDESNADISYPVPVNGEKSN